MLARVLVYEMANALSDILLEGNALFFLEVLSSLKWKEYKLEKKNPKSFQWRYFIKKKFKASFSEPVM